MGPPRTARGLRRSGVWRRGRRPNCLTGCAIGEILGLIIATWLGLATAPSVVLAIALAFVFGYALTLIPLLRAGTGLRASIGLALAADTLSIVIMELVDNAFLVAVPGAMEAGLFDLLFWVTLATGFGIAWVVTFPVNRWLIARGRGHALVHAAHDAAGGHPEPHRTGH